MYNNSYLATVLEIKDTDIILNLPALNIDVVLTHYKKKIGEHKRKYIKPGYILPVLVSENQHVKLDLGKNQHKILSVHNLWYKFFNFLKKKEYTVSEQTKKQIMKKYYNLQTFLNAKDEKDEKLVRLSQQYIDQNNEIQTIAFELVLYETNGIQIIKKLKQLCNLHTINIVKLTGKTYYIKTCNLKNAISQIQNYLIKYKHTFKICKHT